MVVMMAQNACRVRDKDSQGQLMLDTLRMILVSYTRWDGWQIMEFTRKQRRVIEAIVIMELITSKQIGVLAGVPI